MKKLILLAGIIMLLSIVYSEEVKRITPKPNDSVFYVYKDAGSRLNHFIPAGWMGDFGDLKMNTRYYNNEKKEDTCIKIIYSAAKTNQEGWAGIYWQMPANNWGDKRGGYDLSGYSKLVFKVRGSVGKEYIDKFLVGGITGKTEDGDSDEVYTDAVELTTEWKEITLDLKGRDMSHIIGGFGFAINSDYNEKGASFYIDEIRFEK